MDRSLLVRGFLACGSTREEAAQRADHAISFSEPYLGDLTDLRYYYESQEDGLHRCVVLARDRDGPVRDRMGRPTLVQFGNVLQGTEEEQIRQAICALAEAYSHVEGDCPEIHIVFDMKDQSFQVSATVIRALLNFPQTLCIDVCGVSSWYLHGWNFAKVFLPASLAEMCRFDTDYRILEDSFSTLPSKWGGTGDVWKIVPPVPLAAALTPSPMSPPTLPRSRSEVAYLVHPSEDAILLSSAVASSLGVGYCLEEVRNVMALYGIAKCVKTLWLWGKK